MLAARVQDAAGGSSGVVASSAYTFDDAGRTTSVVRTGPGASDANYSYTSAGRLSGAAWSTGASEAYDYNQVGELTQVSPSGVAGVGVVQYGYDPSGRVSTVTRNGTAAAPMLTLVSYDAAGQVSALEHSSGSTVVDAYGMTRDVLGNPTQVDTTTATGTETSSALYGYDNAGRLRSECYPATGEACTGRSPRNLYTYDLVGNRASESARTVVGTKATTVVTDYAYDAGDQSLTESVGGFPTVSNTWTPNGVLATATTAMGTTAYTSDLMDELTSLTLPDGTAVGYTTDVSGNRTSRTVDGMLDVSWVWDELSALPVRIGETNATGTLTSSWLPDPTSATGTPLAETTGGTSSWMLSDPFLNVAASVSMTGTVSGTKTLDAFGETRTTATGTLATSPMGFAGQYLDDATGMYDMRARDYNPSSGRFNAMDAVAVPTGTPYFAAYTYGYGNPLVFSDPDGNWASGGVRADWLDNAAAWSAAFGDTVTFGGTEQIRRLVSYEQGSGDVDMVDHDSLFYEWGGHGGDTANVGLIFIGGAGCAESSISRMEQGLSAMNRAEAGTELVVGGTEAVVGADGAVSTVANGVKLATNGASSVRVGQAGEEAVRSMYAIGPKATRAIDGRTRIFDGLNDAAVSEVKNVNYQSFTQQLRDSLEYAKAKGLRFDLYVRGGDTPTRLSAPLEQAVRSGEITLRAIP